jgi:predicted alpha/beta hydrolase family esterase
MNPHRIVIVPGWRNSGPDHWQSLWAQQLPHAERVQQEDWLVPHREPWVAALEAQVLSQPGPVVIVAHSLGCITAAHMGVEASARVKGALLVAPADPERRA